MTTRSLGALDDLISQRELADCLGVKVKTIQNQIDQLPPYIRLPGGRFWYVDTINVWLERKFSEAGALPTKQPSNAGRPTKAEQIRRRNEGKA